MDNNSRTAVLKIIQNTSNFRVLELKNELMNRHFLKCHSIKDDIGKLCKKFGGGDIRRSSFWSKIVILKAAQAA